MNSNKYHVLLYYIASYRIRFLQAISLEAPTALPETSGSLKKLGFLIACHVARWHGRLCRIHHLEKSQQRLFYSTSLDTL